MNAIPGPDHRAPADPVGTIPSADHRAPDNPVGTIPGEVLPGDGDVLINAGRPVRTMVVTNTGDRPVQVGSHYHFGEANPALSFDRAAAWGHRLAVPAGTSVRFEPGMAREVSLVPFGGRRVVAGLRGECAGPLDKDRAGRDTDRADVRDE